MKQKFFCEQKSREPINAFPTRVVALCCGCVAKYLKNHFVQAFNVIRAEQIIIFLLLLANKFLL